MGQNATQRSVLRTFGQESYAPFILAPVAQTYVIDAACPGNFSLISLVGIFLSAGTVTAKLQIQPAGGSAVDITGLTALAITTTPQTFTPTALNYIASGSALLLVLSAPSSAANLAMDVRVQRQSH